MSKSFFNKVAGLRPATLSKRDTDVGIFPRILQHFLEQFLRFFIEHLRATASVQRFETELVKMSHSYAKL